MTKSKKENISSWKWFLWSVPVLFITGSIMHFVYEWSGQLVIASLFAPVNESVWEHLKMSFWPVLIWWIVGYFIIRKKYEISYVQWFVSLVVALLVCPLVIVSFFYTYTGAFGFESIILDIFSLLLGLIIGQMAAFHIFRFAKFNRYWLYGAILIIILMSVAFIIFTFVPPDIPLFGV